MSDKDINRMDFKELRNEVQLLRDELAIFKRKYEDIIYNLDNDNFSPSLIKEKDGMKAEISITAEAIKTKLSREDFDNAIINYSTIEQTADKISTAVTAIFSSPEETEIFYQGIADKDKVYYEKSQNRYWYFNGSSWVTSNNATFGTVFEQTAYGFSLNGLVEISGDLITTGTISADRISTEIGQVASRLYIGDGTDIEEKEIIFGDSARIMGVLGPYGGLTDIETSSRAIRFSGLSYAVNYDSTSPCIYANEKLLATQDWVKANAGGGTTTVVFG